MRTPDIDLPDDDDGTDDGEDSLEERIATVESILFLIGLEIGARHLALDDLERRARELALGLEEMRAVLARREGRLQ
jgi:hypothetical protein